MLLRSAKRYARVFFVTFSALFFIVFAVDNRDPTKLSLFPFPWEAQVPLFLVALLFFLLGALIGYYMAIMQVFGTRKQLKNEQHRNKALQNQLDAVRGEYNLSSGIVPAKPGSLL